MATTADVIMTQKTSDLTVPPADPLAMAERTAKGIV